MMSQTLRDFAIARIHSMHPDVDERGVLDQLLVELYGFRESPEGDIHRFASLLDAAEAPCMLTGSFASGFHGAPRATQDIDIDIVISPTLGSLSRFLRLLPEDKYYVSRDAVLDAYGRESPFNVVDFRVEMES